MSLDEYGKAWVKKVANDTPPTEGDSPTQVKPGDGGAKPKRQLAREYLPAIFQHERDTDSSSEPSDSGR